MYAIRSYYEDRPALNLNNGFGISVNAGEDKAIKIIKLLDTLIQEDWQRILTWGIEGEDYYVNEQGRYMMTEEQRHNVKDETWILGNKAKMLFKVMPKMEGYFADGNATDAAAQPEEYKAGSYNFV